MYSQDIHRKFIDASHYDVKKIEVSEVIQVSVHTIHFASYNAIYYIIYIYSHNFLCLIFLITFYIVKSYVFAFPSFKNMFSSFLSFNKANATMYRFWKDLKKLKLDLVLATTSKLQFYDPCMTALS